MKPERYIAQLTFDRRPGYIPPKRPYSFTKMLEDLLNFAADLLVDEGRLAFWMPTASEASDEEQGLNIEGDKALGIPTNPRLELVSVCTQPFNKCRYYRPSQKMTPPSPKTKSITTSMVQGPVDLSPIEEYQTSRSPTIG